MEMGTEIFSGEAWLAPGVVFWPGLDDPTDAVLSWITALPAASLPPWQAARENVATNAIEIAALRNRFI